MLSTDQAGILWNLCGLCKQKLNMCTSVLELLSPVVGAVLALQAEVNIGADAAVVQWLDGANVIAHAQEDLRWLVLAEQSQGVHLI